MASYVSLITDWRAIARYPHQNSLPTDDGDRRQQFWDPDTRDRFLRWIDERAYDAIETDGLDARLEVRDRS